MKVQVGLRLSMKLSRAHRRSGDFRHDEHAGSAAPEEAGLLPRDGYQGALMRRWGVDNIWMQWVASGAAALEG